MSECLLPSNVNPLNPNGFNFYIAKLPNVSFFCQRVMIPGLTLGVIEQPNPFTNRAIPGEIMTFSELSVQFLIDEKMENYKAIFNWMRALGFPKDHSEYSNFVNEQGNNIYSELAKNFSDATVSVLDGMNVQTNSFKFYDVFPISMDPVQFESTAMDVNYVIGSATFKYTTFEIDV